jgi:hypothetical protein
MDAQFPGTNAKWCVPVNEQFPGTHAKNGVPVHPQFARTHAKSSAHVHAQFKEARKKRHSCALSFSRGSRKILRPYSSTISTDGRRKLYNWQAQFPGTHQVTSLCTQNFLGRTQNGVPVHAQFPGRLAKNGFLVHVQFLWMHAQLPGLHGKWCVPMQVQLPGTHAKW